MKVVCSAKGRTFNVCTATFLWHAFFGSGAHNQACLLLFNCDWLIYWRQRKAHLVISVHACDMHPKLANHTNLKQIESGCTCSWVALARLWASKAIRLRCLIGPFIDLEDRHCLPPYTLALYSSSRSDVPLSISRPDLAIAMPSKTSLTINKIPYPQPGTPFTHCHEVYPARGNRVGVFHLA